MQMLTALCCVCGHIRRCARPRNHRTENYWFAREIDRDWHRETGELKCSECNRVTVHALIHPEGDQMRDHAEMMQRVATGNGHGHFNAEELAEVRRKYRQGFPQNPYLHHFYYIAAAEADWNAGRRNTLAACGASMKLDFDPKKDSDASQRTDDDEQLKPRIVKDGIEWEDAETGLSWMSVDCVDCLRVWHLYLLRQRQGVLMKRLAEFLADLTEDRAGGYPKRFDLTVVNGLIDALVDAYGVKETENAGARK